MISLRSFSHILCLLTIIHCVIGDSQTYVSIHNLTPFGFFQQSISASGLFSTDVWSFPTSIVSGTAAEGHVHFISSAVPANSISAAVRYTVATPDGRTEIGTFDIWLDNSSPGSPTIRAQLNGFGAIDVNNGEHFELGFTDDNGKITPFILAGGGHGSSFTATYPRDSWMQDDLKALGCRQLRELIIPGSHDSGMSEFHRAVGGATNYETLTQTLNIHDQLAAGVRYFDIRPVIDGGHYETGHFETSLRAGANGQSMQNVIWNINNFTEYNSELIILSLASSVNRDNDFKTFDQDDWDGLTNMLSQINYRYTLPCTGTCDFTQMTLNHFIGDGNPVVLMINHDGGHSLSQGSGIYDSSSFKMTGSYTPTMDLDTMRQDQYSKLLQYRTSSTSEVFQLFWTATTGANFDGVISHARWIYNYLFDASVPSSSDIVADPSGLLLATSNTTYPNIVTMDNIQDGNWRRVTSLIIGMNRLYATCP